MDIFEIYPNFNILEIKRSLIIYLLTGYNILISSKRYINSFCSDTTNRLKIMIVYVLFYVPLWILYNIGKIFQWLMKIFKNILIY